MMMMRNGTGKEKVCEAGVVCAGDEMLKWGRDEGDIN